MIILITRGGVGAWGGSNRSEMKRRVLKALVKSPKDKPTKRAHELKEEFSLAPSFCSICGGIIFGTGWTCAGPCGLRCHRMAGLHDEDENCKAKALVRPCTVDFQHARTEYEFGDGVKQIGRDIGAQMAEGIIKVAVQGQKRLGKLDRLKDFVGAVRKRYTEDDVVEAMLRWVWVSALGLAGISYVGVLGMVISYRGMRSSSALATMQASSNVFTLLLVQGWLWETDLEPNPVQTM